MQNGDTFHGISVFGRGVFTHDTYGWNYAGQCKDGHACGLGVLTDSFFGNKEYAEHGPDGQFDGRFLGRNATGDTWYQLFERGRQKVYALVYTQLYLNTNGPVLTRYRLSTAGAAPQALVPRVQGHRQGARQVVARRDGLVQAAHARAALGERAL